MVGNDRSWCGSMEAASRTGSGADGSKDGVNLYKRGDAVVVSLNHRLNIFGFLHLGDIGGEKYAASGNPGMLDIVLALQWVRDNIAQFGGDILSRTQLKAALGEEAKGEKARIIDVHIAALRKKLGAAKNVIKTVHSRGYRIAQ